MEARVSFYISLSIHVIAFLSYYLIRNLNPETFSEQIKLSLSKGQIPSLHFSLPKNSGEGPNTSSNSDIAGTPEAEIERFKNEIHFPPEALEQRLESDCSWEVLIGANGAAKKVTTIKPCKYKVFETQFRRSVSSWKFQLPEGNIIIIPVSFRIESDE
ncbi:LIC_10042 family TonB-like protein [Leptospira licerasiae]|uniref:TonB-dependent receptor n=1 Tax=Leptospira licerasiae str. MMD4847 TaxID=1049971 RepID=A0ABN0HBJ3_9LEPT|nr:energy transducer TonB [Leptospira licerasiae]EIE02627.1 TonB-dependent receptor [Leptospira licerasiae serovar Varillal str. VAR 010]EJZ42854.1 TonB-dependent receptor [Leptospira licerasiae str. MMD4847]